MSAQHPGANIFALPNIFEPANIFDDAEVERIVIKSLQRSPDNDNDPAGSRPKGPRPS